MSLIGRIVNLFIYQQKLSFVLGQQAHEVKALYSQTAEKQGRIEMQVGDLLGIAGNEKDGTSKGKNKRTSAYGEYLSYKVEEVPIIADFPTTTQNYGN